MENINPRIKSIVFCALFIALITIGAKITIPMPLAPFTLQPFFCVMAGIMLGGNLGALSVLLYTILGLVGVPVFATGAGPSYVFSPTFGYLLAFIIEAFIVGKVIERMPTFSFKKVLAINLIGIALVYIIGMIYYILLCIFYFSKPVDIWTIFYSFCLIFMPKDVAFCFLTTFITKRLWNLKLK